jgi:ribosomal protein L40E
MHSKAICPKCRAEIPLEDVNVAKDIALCRRCGTTSNYAEVIEDAETAFDPMKPPRGTWFREQPPLEFEVGASTRSAAALFLVPFMCVWSGFSLGGIYGTQFAKGHFDLFQSLFGIPFILGTLFFGGMAVMTVCGKVVVNVNGDQGAVFTGVGPIGWRRRFSWREVTGMRRTMAYSNRRMPSPQITFEGTRPISFGTGVKQERLDFMLTMLRKQWRESGH